MLLLTTFCSNAINIHAGLNGLEVGQSFVIGCSGMVAESVSHIINNCVHSNNRSV